MKCSKAIGVDGIAAQFLKKGEKTLVDWLKEIFSVCINAARVPEH